MRAALYSILFILFGMATAQAQTFTFQCVDSTALTGANCDICPGNSTILSRSLCGLLISKNGAPYKWIDQPYTMRVKTGNNVEYMEQIPNQDKITISLAQTPFSTLQGMIDSTWCHCKTGVNTDTTALFYASDSIDHAPIFRGDTLFIVGRGLAQVEFDSALHKYVINVDSIAGGGGIDTISSGNLSPLFTVSIANPTTTPHFSFAQINQNANLAFMGPPTGAAAAPTFRALVLADILGLNTANNGLSDNEAGGGIFRLGNVFMNGSDGLFGTDRKVNVNAKMLFIGDNTDSTLFVVDGTNDRVGVGRLPLQRLDISGSGGVYTRVNTTGAVAISGFILNNSADANASWAIHRQDDGDLGIGSSDNEWPSGTLTVPVLIKPNPPDNSFYMAANGRIQLGGNNPQRVLHVTGEARITDLVTDNPTLLVGADADGDLSGVTLGSGLSFSGTTLNPADNSATNEAWTIDADDADTEVISNQTVKFEGAGGVTTDYVPGTDKLIITGPGAPVILTANNALTITGTNLQWGGTLVQNTTVDQNTFYQLHKDGRKEFYRYDTGNPFTDVNVTGTVDITGKGLAPSLNTAPSEDNILTIRGHNGTSTYYANALFMGVYPTAADGTWIQSRSESAYTTKYLMNINPRGGRVAIGRDPESDDPDAHVTISQAVTGSTITGILLHLENGEGNKAAMSMGVGTDIIKGEVGYFDGADAVRLTTRNTQSTSSIRFALGGETSDKVVMIAAGTGFGTAVTTEIKSTIQDEGSLGLKTTTSTGNLTLDATHCIVVKNGGSVGVTWTLPDPDACVGRFYWLMNHTSQTITLSRNVTTDNGVTFNTLTGGQFCMISAFNGNGWRGYKQVSL